MNTAVSINYWECFVDLCSRWIGFSSRGASFMWRKRKQTGLVLFYIANFLVLAFIIKSYGKMKKTCFASTVVLDFVGIVWQLIASTSGFRSVNMSTMMSSAFKKCRSILTALKFRFFHNCQSDEIFFYLSDFKIWYQFVSSAIMVLIITHVVI